MPTTRTRTYGTTAVVQKEPLRTGLDFTRKKKVVNFNDNAIDFTRKDQTLLSALVLLGTSSQLVLAVLVVLVVLVVLSFLFLLLLTKPATPRMAPGISQEPLMSE